MTKAIAGMHEVVIRISQKRVLLAKFGLILMVFFIAFYLLQSLPWLDEQPLIDICVIVSLMISLQLLIYHFRIGRRGFVLLISSRGELQYSGLLTDRTYIIQRGSEIDIKNNRVDVTLSKGGGIKTFFIPASAKCEITNPSVMQEV